jgi:hypothetical protein
LGLEENDEEKDETKKKRLKPKKAFSCSLRLLLLLSRTAAV